jgi:hypothetical protein
LEKILMVTERNDAGSESQVEVADNQVSFDNTQTESVTPDLTETADPPIEVAPQTEPQTETQNTEEASTPQASDEFRKYQSATDKQLAEMQTQLKSSEEARVLAEQQTNANNLSAEVSAYTQQLEQTFVEQGLDEGNARQMAASQANMAKQAYLADQRANQISQRQRQVETDLNSRTQLAKAYELSSQYAVPYGELQDFPDPQSMERHAKALSRISKLEKTVQQVTPAQQLSGATPGADVAPTNSEDVLDRYNAGDPAVTTEMARSAAQRLGHTSLFN